MVLIRKMRNRAAHVYSLAILLDIFLICRPLEAAWDTSIHGEIGNQVLSYLLLEVFGLLIDLTILAMPSFLIYKLDKPWKVKASVSGMLSLRDLQVSSAFYRDHYSRLIGQ